MIDKDIAGQGGPEGKTSSRAQHFLWTMFWPPRQPADPLASIQALLVAQHVSWYLPLYQQMLSLCHFQSPRCLPQGKLMPLLVPQRPWSHMTIDFFMTCPCLMPSPVFYHHFCIPEEIVSDRGSQFTSQVWKAFFNLLGAAVITFVIIHKPVTRVSARSRT